MRRVIRGVASPPRRPTRRGAGSPRTCHVARRGGGELWGQAGCGERAAEERAAEERAVGRKLWRGLWGSVLGERRECHRVSEGEAREAEPGGRGLVMRRRRRRRRRGERGRAERGGGEGGGGAGGDGGDGDAEEHRGAHHLQLQRQPSLQSDREELRTRGALEQRYRVLARRALLAEGANVPVPRGKEGGV